LKHFHKRLWEIIFSKWTTLIITIIIAIAMFIGNEDYYFVIGLVTIILWIYLTIIITANIKKYLLTSFVSLILHHILFMIKLEFFVEIGQDEPDGMILIFNFFLQPYLLIPFIIMVVRFLGKPVQTPWFEIILVLIITSPILYILILGIIEPLF